MVGSVHLVNLYVPAELVREHLVHQPLICGPRVLEFEWHHLVAEKSLASYKRGLLLILLLHFDLVIA